MGQKAFQLAKLKNAGFKVPSGFAVSMLEDLDAIADDTWLNAVQKIGDFPVAVRSSMACEDGKEHSFAGIFESVLNVSKLQELRLAVQRVCKSKDSPRVASYLQFKKLTVPEMGGAILVQKMVAPKFSGVAFTKFPIANNREQALIEYCAGANQSTVDGTSNPQRIFIDLRDPKDHGEPKEGSATHMSASELKKLCQVLVDIEAYMQSPQDVEWAIDSEQVLWILQSRFITS